MGETKGKSYKFQIGARTNVGCIRKNNEDNFVVNPDLSEEKWFLPQNQQTFFTLGDKGAMLVVADGMGGLDAGEIASQIVVETIKEYFRPDKITDEIVADTSSIRKYMLEAVIAADMNIRQKSREEKTIKSMGTTIVATWILNGFANIVWCGDSRAYLFSAVSGLSQVTKDHSYVQELVDSGKLLPEYAFDHPDSNIITRSLGNPNKAAHPDFVQLQMREGEILLLCTDGLNSMLHDEEIEMILQNTSADSDLCLNTLIDSVLDAGGHDNVTIILYRSVSGDNEKPGSEMQQTVSTFRETKQKSFGRQLLCWGLILVIGLFAWQLFVVKTGGTFHDHKLFSIPVLDRWVDGVMNWFEK